MYHCVTYFHSIVSYEKSSDGNKEKLVFTMNTVISKTSKQLKSKMDT